MFNEHCSSWGGVLFQFREVPPLTIQVSRLKVLNCLFGLVDRLSDKAEILVIVVQSDEAFGSKVGKIGEFGKPFQVLEYCVTEEDPIDEKQRNRLSAGQLEAVEDVKNSKQLV